MKTGHGILLSIFITAILSAATVDIQAQQLKRGTINRKQVVQRHNLNITDPHEQGPTQVGNGNFAYGFDITGMQTYNDQFTTMSQWSWHSIVPPDGLTAADFEKTDVNTNGRMIPYELPNPKQSRLTHWMQSNPHRFNLARIGLCYGGDTSRHLTPEDIDNPSQFLDLWTATAVSTFEINGKQVKVTTIGDPRLDAVAFRIESPLISTGNLRVFIDFPYANLDVFSNGSDYTKPDLHTTDLVMHGKQQMDFNRKLDSTIYKVAVHSSRNVQVKKVKPHQFVLSTSGSSIAEFVFYFSPGSGNHSVPSFSTIKAHTEKYWPAFWNSGGFIDLSQSKDQRWKELERRIVLSQYIMKVNAAGDYPPQETGLVNNSWYGRFHYEMILWHEAHYALWDRWSLIEKSLQVYKNNLADAKQRAASQGYLGARYPKCTGPDGREWPHPIHAFLVWQQPHPIFFADLDYRLHPSVATLKKWSDVIEASADFLASYAVPDSAGKQYMLGPPVAFVPENNDYYKDYNPAFELTYWRYALKKAQSLQALSGSKQNPLWDSVYRHLAPVPVQDSLYVQWENVRRMWDKFNFEHPALLGIYGLLPGDGVDVAIMRKTLSKVVKEWKFDTGWGWDFPLAAMCAARVGEPALAIDFLLHPSSKNNYDKHGFVGGGNPYPYLPANGALLYAVAMMTAGWDGDKDVPTPGFPADGSWTVCWEDLRKAP
ncbi:MAG: hypothetical protein J0I32_04990 [Sphingobacteriales bacterium]|nr:hypothetical protein [Sphingobacteriales bacterium]OJV98512.1 MAG: hypothetical protein BGO52_12085 [Sphingobacteriales bacterium 44-61]